MTVRINKQKINLREKLTEFEDKVNFDEVVRGLGEYTGNVGIGTSNPSTRLQIASSGGSNTYPLQILGSNTDRNRIAGIFDTHVQGTNRSAGALALHESDFTTSVFLTAYPNSNCYINNGGNVGIGTTNPGYAFEVLCSNDDGLSVVGASDTNNGWRLKPSGNDLRIGQNDIADRVTFQDGGNVGIGTTNPNYELEVIGDINASVNLRAAGSIITSDDRAKHNEQNIVGAIETLGKLTPKKYIKTTEMYEANHDFELDENGNPVDADGEPVEHTVEAGVIAQQVLGVPELAFMVSPEGVDEDGNVTSPHGLNYNSLFTYAIAAIQEQQSIIEDLKSRIETLESK